MGRKDLTAKEVCKANRNTKDRWNIREWASDHRWMLFSGSDIGDWANYLMRLLFGHESAFASPEEHNKILAGLKKIWDGNNQ